MKAAGAAALLCALACTPDFRVTGDPAQPFPLDLTTGVPTAFVQLGGTVTTAVLDTGSPVSTLALADGCRADTSLALGQPVRLAFPDLHPYCVTRNVVGGDLFVHYEAIFAGDRCQNAGALACLQLATQEVESTTELSQEIPPFAVLSFRLLGGGTFVDDTGRLHTWPATRVPLRVCINPTKSYMPGPAPGYDTTLLVATGQQPLGLTQATIKRIGLETGTPIQRIALVGHTLGGSVQDPGACGELQRARCLNAGGNKLSCEMAVLTDMDSWDNDVDVEAYVILEGPTDVTMVADGDPYVVGASTEVQPRISGIDGFHGASILNRLEQIRIDYLGVSSDDVDSSTRFITRCKPGDATCSLCARHSKSGSPICQQP